MLLTRGRLVFHHGATLGSLAPGLEAGLYGAIAMWVALMLAALLRGLNPLTPLALLGALVLGPDVLEVRGTPGLAAILGTVLTLAIGPALGALYVGSLIAIGKPNRVEAAVLFSLAVWAVAQLLLLPRFAPVFVQHVSPALFAAGHVLFGLFLGAAPTDAPDES